MPSKNQWQVTRNYLQHTEKHAFILRRQAMVGPTDKLDPRALADKLKLKIMTLDEIQGLTSEMLQIDVKEWSGGAQLLPDGRLLVVLNPHQTPERANVTILEEKAHAYYGHKPSQLIRGPGGLETRKYNESDEREAYWTAAAVLLPSKVVAQAIWCGQPAKTLAAKYGASIELAEMRIKTLNLWPHYQKYV